MNRTSGAAPMVLLVLASWAHASASAQLSKLESANQLVRAGYYRAAEGAYTDVLSSAPAGDSTTRALALFGRSFAAQQVTSPDSGPGRPAEAILTDYLQARTLDSARLYASASNNAGVLLRAAGRHREAVGYFLDAARTTDSARAYFQFNAGQEYEALQQGDSAGALYREAIDSRPDYTEARVGLLQLYVRRPAPDSLLAIARRWTDPSALGPVNDAILSLLANARADTRQPDAEGLFVVLTRNLAAQQPDPGYFARTHTPRLTPIVRARPFLEPAVVTLLDAYQERKPGKRYAGPPATAWWYSGYDRDRAASWSSTLRSLGDYYYQAGEEETAASYYEAALEYPKRSSPAPWADLGALMPLGVIYGHRTAAGPKNRQTVEGLNEYVNFLFGGKGQRYQANELRQARSFHMALGEIFAEQGQWGSGTDARSAIFQLERMRMLTRLLKDKARDQEVFDPPELLERLATGYRQTGQQSLARPVAEAARDGYVRLGRTEDARRLQAVIDGVRPE